MSFASALTQPHRSNLSFAACRVPLLQGVSALSHPSKDYCKPDPTRASQHNCCTWSPVHHCSLHPNSPANVGPFLLVFLQSALLLSEKNRIAVRNPYGCNPAKRTDSTQVKSDHNTHRWQKTISRSPEAFWIPSFSSCYQPRHPRHVAPGRASLRGRRR